jgi:ubiquinone/menaquinone biosynthesis C-methylase UbiE
VSGRQNTKNNKKLSDLATYLVAKVGRPIIRHLSDLARESLKQPGSWRCLEIIYQNEPRTLLDRFFLSSRSARGARNRLQLLQGQIYKLIEDFGKLHNPVRIASFGSGPGHEILGSIEKLAASVTVKALCMDQDPSAIKYGRSLASQKDLADCVEYFQGNVLRMNLGDARYDIALLSGLTDYFEDDIAVSVLTNVRERLLEGGVILVANMRKHYLASTMSALGNWNLVYREPPALGEILERSGYEDINVMMEPEKVFCIGKGRKLN